MGAVLDRNGLRPSPLLYHQGRPPDPLQSRWACWISPPDDIVKKDRLRPGKMLLVDTVKGELVDDEELQGTTMPPASPTANGWTATWSS